MNKVKEESRLFSAGMTDEQKYWYLKGYIECWIDDISHEQNISQNLARRFIVNVIRDVVEKE